MVGNSRYFEITFEPITFLKDMNDRVKVDQYYDPSIPRQVRRLLIRFWVTLLTAPTAPTTILWAGLVLWTGEWAERSREEQTDSFMTGNGFQPDQPWIKERR